MTTAEDILKKHKERKRKNFEPIVRRAWDNIASIDSSEKSTSPNENKKSENEHKSNIGTDIGTNRNKYRNNISTDIGTYRNIYGNKYRDNISTDISTDIGTENSAKKQVQIDSKSVEGEEKKIIKILRKTTGSQKEIMEEITAHIKSISNNENVIDIPIETLSIRINRTKDVVRTSIKRLQKKSILLKGKGQHGRLGTTKIIVPNFIIKECINLFHCLPKSLDENYIENGGIYRNKYRNNDFVYSSSNNINTTTRVEQLLPEEWKAINIEPLQEHGFSLTQLKQLYVINITSPEIIQESINHFAFGLKNNPKFSNYKDPLNVLMGVLRKGEAWHEKDYKSPKELAMERIIEQKRAEQERIKKLEEQIFLTALEEWKKTKSEEELNKLLPAGNIPPRSVKISLYFKENIWPTVKKDYLL